MPLPNYERRWDDLRFPATGISLGGFTAPPDVQADTGLLLFNGIDTVETVGVLAQMPHTWQVGSPVRPHVHWAKTTDAAGDVAWTLRYKWFSRGELQGNWSNVITATVATPEGGPGSTQVEVISTFGDLTPPGSCGVSSLILIQLGRLYSAEGDTYEADALLYEFDIHYISDSDGTTGEFSGK